MADDPHIKRTLLGIGGFIVVYRCQHCAAKLKSPIDEVGTADTCPACGAAFIVPGAAERDRLRNEKIEKEEAKRALAEAKRKAKTEPASSDAVPPNPTDTSPPLLGSQPSRKRFIAAIAIAASLAILAAVGLAFFLGRHSAVRAPQPVPSAARPLAAGRIIWDDVDQSRTTAAKTPAPVATVEPPTEETPKREAADTRRIIAIAEESVVTLKVSIRDENATSAGSGFVLKPGVVVTNYHVIEDAAVVLVKFQDGRNAYSIGYLAADKENDLALLKCDTEAIKPLTLGVLPQKLDPVFAIGSPHGVFSGTISNGIVSGLVERKRTGTVMIQTTAPISPGSSGGPLLNDSGEVIGITTESLTDAQNVNFAVAASHVTTLATIAQNVARPWRDLPTSAAAKRRAELRRLAARIDALAKEALHADDQVGKTYGMFEKAQSEAHDLALQAKAVFEQMESYRLAGDRVRFEQATSDLSKWRPVVEEAVDKRERLSAKMKEEVKRRDDLVRQFEMLRQQYEELRAKQAED